MDTVVSILEEARAIARYFLSLGFPRGTPFAILSEGRNGWVIAEFGLLMAGLVSVPLSIKLLPKEVLFRLNHSGARGIVVSADTIELEEKLERSIAMIREDDVVTISYTLGGGLSPYSRSTTPSPAR